MSQSHEAHRLAIQNLSVLEQVPQAVSEAETRIFSAINEKVNDWTSSQNNWEGVFDYYSGDMDDTSIKPVEWEKDEDGSYMVYYNFRIDEKANELFWYYLSALVGAVPYEIGFWFDVNATWVTRLTGKGARPGAAWKKFLTERFPDFPEIAKNGFRVEGESLFLPIRVDAQLLAESYPDSLDDALGPVDEALEKLKAAHPSIAALLKTALAHQF